MTHQQTQIIVDAVEGIYQNTLTIALSVTENNLSGLYSCMVENSRGSSNRTAFFGYGKTVEALMVKILKLLTVTLAIDYYHQMFRPQCINVVVFFSGK